MKYAIAGWASAVMVSLSLPVLANWPMARQNAKRTGAVPGQSDITHPAAYWRYYIGGAISGNGLLVEDVNNDSAREAVLVAAGRVVVKWPDDEIVWEAPARGIVQIIGITDLNGDGRRDIVTASTDHVYVYGAEDGRLEWAEPDGEMGTLAAVRISDLDGDRLPDLLIQECGCCGANSGNPGFVYSFGKGFNSPSLLWRLPWTICGAGYGMTIVDMDGVGEAPKSCSVATALWRYWAGAPAVNSHVARRSEITPPMQCVAGSTSMVSSEPKSSAF